MKFTEVLKSQGAAFLLLIGVLLNILSYVLGFINSFKEGVFVFIGSIIVALFYCVVRMIPSVDEPIFFAKKWKE